MLEADTDSNGYDAFGEPTAVWGFLRIALERGGPSDSDQRMRKSTSTGSASRFSVLQAKRDLP